MTFVPNANVGKVCVIIELNSIEISFCYYMTKSSPTPAEFQTLADQAALNMSDWVNSGISDDLTVTLVRVYDMASDSAPVYTSLMGLPITGGNTTDSLPNNCALVITFRSDDRGRSGRGRIYLPGLADNQVVDGLVLPATTAARLADFVTYIGNVEVASGFTHTLYQQQDEGEPLTTAVLRDVTVYTSTDVVRSQRRRTRVL